MLSARVDASEGQLCEIENGCWPTMSLIAPGIKFWSWRGALHVAQSFTMFCLPGYALYRLNTSEWVRGDLEQKLPKRPDLPMGGNASNRVYSPAEQNLQAMLTKVERVRGLAARAPQCLSSLSQIAVAV